VIKLQLKATNLPITCIAMAVEFPISRVTPPTTDNIDDKVLREREEETKRVIFMEKGSSNPENLAKYIQFPNGYPKMIIEIGVARGGTTAMSKVLACSPSFDAFGEDILRNAITYPKDQGRDPISIQMPGENNHVFLKETYGPSTESMISYYPLLVWQLAAERAGISEKEFIQKTRVLGVTRDPLAIYNGWLKYWTIIKGLTSIDEAFEKFGQLSLTNLIAAYNCFSGTVLSALDQGLETNVVVAKMFENSAQGVEGVIQKICDKIGIEFTHDMVMFQDSKKEQKIDLYPVSVDSKYKGLHKQIDDRGFRYLPPNYNYSDEILPSLQKAGLMQCYRVLHHIAEHTFGQVGLPSYMT